MKLQIHLRPILEAKETLHALYADRSAFERVGGDSLSDDHLKEIDRLNGEMRAVYDAAWERSLRDKATRSQNLVSEIDAPLRRAESGSNERGGSTSQADEYRGDPSTLPSETGIPSTSKNSAIRTTPSKSK